MRSLVILSMVTLLGCAADDVATPDAAPGVTASARAVQGESCAATGTCGDGLACVRYTGVAGAEGGAIATCEIRCSVDTECGDGQTCELIEGPGRVCR